MMNAFNEQRQSISKRNGKIPIKLVKTRKSPLRNGNHQPERGVYGDFFEKRERGTRYLDAKTSRWLSTDPALGEYIPGAPVNDQVKKQNQNLPRMGGVFNVVNMHLYHYGSNNPIRYLDPNGRTGSFPDGSPEQNAAWERGQAARRELLNQSTFSEGVIDFVGKLWASPVTAFGLVAGLFLTGISIITGNGGRISLENNAITFTTGLKLFGRSSVTFGNVIIHTGGKEWNSSTTIDRYDGAAKINLGKHEEKHTYQYQEMGVFFLLVYGIQSIADGLGSSYLDVEADDYAELPGTRIR